MKKKIILKTINNLYYNSSNSLKLPIDSGMVSLRLFPHNSLYFIIII